MPNRDSRFGSGLKSFFQHWRWWPVTLWYAALILSALYVVFVIFFTQPATSLAVDAQTEYLSFVATDPRELNWSVGGFELKGCVRPNGAPEPLRLDENAMLRVGVGTVVTITKTEGSPQASIELARAAGGAVPTGGSGCGERTGVWLINGSSSERPLYGAHLWLTRRDPEAPATVLPLRGIVTLGQDPAAGPQELLMSGQVSLHATNLALKLSSVRRWLHGNSTYVPQTLVLQRGDVVLPPSKDKDLSEARGFLRIPAKEILQVGYAVEAGRVIVQRPGNATLELTLTLWDRLKNEPDLTGAVALLVALLGAGTLAEDVGKGWRFASKSTQPE